jgi:hypothetical protein
MSEKGQFDHFIGIHYSGAEAADSPLGALQVYMASPRGEPRMIPRMTGPALSTRWSRQDLARWLASRLADKERVIVGIDHPFSFPVRYFERNCLDDWDAFLDDFCHWWKTDSPHLGVDECRRNNPRTGLPNEMRLTDLWAGAMRSVFLFHGHGATAGVTHAGLPWLRFLRRHPKLQNRLHFWPFDGFEVPPHRSVIVEVYPPILRRRYRVDNRMPHQQDAFAVASWLRDMSEGQVLERYFDVPLLEAEDAVARREGWILGVG